jgi:hypothetical protein
MIAHPLIYVRVTTHYPIPPVCSAHWTPDDWARTAHRTCEPLVVDLCGAPWVATGERNAHGALLYRAGGAA